MATLILLPWPAVIGYRRFYQGILIVMIKFLFLMGVVAAAAAYILGRISANIYLMPSYRKAINKFLSNND